MTIRCFSGPCCSRSSTRSTRGEHRARIGRSRGGSVRLSGVRRIARRTSEARHGDLLRGLHHAVRGPFRRAEASDASPTAAPHDGRRAAREDQTFQIPEGRLRSAAGVSDAGTVSRLPVRHRSELHDVDVPLRVELRGRGARCAGRPVEMLRISWRIFARRRHSVVVGSPGRRVSRDDLRFDGLWGRSLRPIDVQNLLCEVSKYTRATHPQIKGRAGRGRIKQKFTAAGPVPRPFFPPKWELNERIEKWIPENSEPAAERPPPLQPICRSS